jgi:hypothetical protein
VGPDLGELAFAEVGETIEERSRDRKLEDGVTEELEPLVRGLACGRPGGVREHLGAAARRKGIYQQGQLEPSLRTRAVTGAR